LFFAIMAIKNFREIQRHNLDALRRQPLAEISGSLGDLGTFLPIVIALTVNESISLPTTLIFTGIFNILTGLFFGIPLPVQPMKAIGAVAIANNFSPGELAAAGLFVAACIALFSITGLLRWFSSVIPIPVVKGIQVGAGLSLIIASGSKILSSLSWIGPSWADNLIWALCAFLFFLYINVSPRTPYALIVFLIGIVFALICLSPHGHSPQVRFWHPYTILPKGKDWEVGILDAGLGQIPLTTLNSIIAVAHLAADLLPEIATPSITSIGLSVAGMNLVGCWFGAMPVCHGSGGLAAQYKFGARSGASIVLLGQFKLFLGLVFGESVVGLLKKFPTALLSIMVIAAGLELASVGESLNTAKARDIYAVERPDHDHGSLVMGDRKHQRELGEAERKQRWSVMLVTLGGLVAFKNDAIGFIAGMLCHYSYEIPIIWRRWQGNRRGGGLEFGQNDGPEDEEGLLSRGRNNDDR
jgi:hypothetical protein